MTQLETPSWDMQCKDLIDEYQMTFKKEGKKYAMKTRKTKMYTYR